MSLSREYNERSTRPQFNRLSEVIAGPDNVAVASRYAQSLAERYYSSGSTVILNATDLVNENISDQDLSQRFSDAQKNILVIKNAEDLFQPTSGAIRAQTELASLLDKGMTPVILASGRNELRFLLAHTPVIAERLPAPIYNPAKTESFLNEALEGFADDVKKLWSLPKNEAQMSLTVPGIVTADDVLKIQAYREMHEACRKNNVKISVEKSHADERFFLTVDRSLEYRASSHARHFYTPAETSPKAIYNP